MSLQEKRASFPMRDHIRLHINGEEVVVNGADAFLTLSDFLRIRRRLTGTKIVCSEGDCGSCSVLCQSPGDAATDYRPIDSCIRFMFQLDGTRILTIEGLKQDGRLNPVQQAMIDCHGSQCGFCTPGFVVAMSSLTQRATTMTEEGLRFGLTGNLCRCTGYTPIIQAGLKATGPVRLPTASSSNGESTNGTSREAVEVSAEVDGETRTVYCPSTVPQAIAFLEQHPQAKIVAGATDLGVQFNKGKLNSNIWLDLNRVRALEGAEIKDGCLVAGARATWTDIEAAMEDRSPQFHAIVRVFGSPQIRHVGTLGGNIVNASPIADSLPFLFVCNAELTLVGNSGTRMVDINNFYRGYKELDLRAGELLTQIKVPLPAAARRMRLYKVSRRRDLDIASFTGAIWVELEDAHIVDAGIAYGGVGPTVIRLAATEDFLRGKTFTIETMTRAGDVAVDEISPISDVRGGADYRLQLARNVLRKFFYQLQQEDFPAAV